MPSLGISASAVVVAAGPQDYVFDSLVLPNSTYVTGVASADIGTARSSGLFIGQATIAWNIHAAVTFGDVEGRKYEFRSTFLQWDTSVLVGKVINSASLTASVMSLEGAGTPVEVRAYDYGTTVDLPDFHLPVETIIATASFVSSVAGVPITGVGSNLINAINKTGFTRFMFSVPSHAGGAAIADNTQAGANFQSVKLLVNAT